MKKFAFLIAVSLLTSVAFAQTVREEFIPFDKENNYSGVVLDVPNGFDVKTVQGALQNRFEQVSKLKGSNTGKFRAYLAQAFPEFGLLNYDIYTQVTEVGKKKDKKTVVYLLVSKGNMNFANSSTDPEIIAGMKNFLTEFLPYLKAYDTSLKAKEQEKLIAKLEKEHKSLVSDQEKLQKQLDNKGTEITKKQDEIQKAKELLQTLQP